MISLQHELLPALLYYFHYFLSLRDQRRGGVRNISHEFSLSQSLRKTLEEIFQ